MEDNREQLQAALQTIPWFQEIDKKYFDSLCGIASVQEVEAGQELFREGDKEDSLYIVLKGRVAMELFIPGRGRMRIYTAEPMDVIGWSSVTPVIRQRTASARAVLPSSLIALNAKQLRQMCEEDHDLGYLVMRRMANVVASRLLTTRLQLLNIFANPVQEVKHE